MTDVPTAVEMLTKAREYIQRGWCQGYFAQTPPAARWRQETRMPARGVHLGSIEAAAWR